VKAAEFLLAVVPYVIEDKKWAVRPAAQHRMIKFEHMDDRLEIVCPQL
jgi:hypothetical protein